ncbi:MAG: hypothetical protein QXG01_04605, partial [Candidatus Bathyarchaeia archaeon]
TEIEISNHMFRGASLNVTVYSIDWEKPRIERNWLYPDHPMEVHVFDSEGNDVGAITYWDGDSWELPTQTAGESSIPYPGWPYPSKLKFNGSMALEERGPDWSITRYTSLCPYTKMAMGYLSNTLFLGLAWPPMPFLWDAGVYRKYVTELSGIDPAHLTDSGATKLGLEADTYSIKGYTVGYVQKKEFKAYVAKGQQADIKLQLVIGANVSVHIKFKKEGQFVHLPYNSSVRVRLYDEDGILRAAYIAPWDITRQIDEGLVTSAICRPPWEVDGIDYSWWVPDSTTDLEVKLVGFDWWYSEPSGPGIYDVTPPFPYTMFYGIDAYPNYDGEWTIEVDVINLYYSDSWYPPPPGLLLGEDGPDTLYPWNHIGPWEQRTEIRVPNVHLSGEASVEMELDLRGYLSGLALGYTWSDEYRPTSWVSVVALGAEGEEVEEVYTFDAIYEMYLPAGDYTLSVEPWPGEAGWVFASTPVHVADGQTSGIGEGPQFLLSQSGTPIPELPMASITMAIVMFAIVAALYGVRRRIKAKNQNLLMDLELSKFGSKAD